MLKPSLLLAFVVVLAGCATGHVDVTKTAKGYTAPSNPNNIEILHTKPERQFAELGTLSASGWPRGNSAKLHNVLRAKAAPLGADAVVILNSGFAENEWGILCHWANAVAIKYEASTYRSR